MISREEDSENAACEPPKKQNAISKTNPTVGKSPGATRFPALQNFINDPSLHGASVFLLHLRQHIVSSSYLALKFLLQVLAGIIMSVSLTGASKSVEASNKRNERGNGWVKLCDNLFGPPVDCSQMRTNLWPMSVL